MRFQAVAWLAPAAGAFVISLIAASPLAAQQGDVPAPSGRALEPSAEAPAGQREPPSGRPAWRDRSDRDMEGQRPAWRSDRDDENWRSGSYAGRDRFHAREDEDEDDRPRLRNFDNRSQDRNRGSSGWGGSRDRDSNSDRERRFGDRDAMPRDDQRRDDASKMRPPVQMGMGGVFCGPLGERFANARLARMERAIQPTEGQRSALEKLREAMAQAQEKISESCTHERPLTQPARLAALEKRLEASLDAIKTVRPALDALYASLSDEQKARLQMMAPQRGFRDGLDSRFDEQRRGEDDRERRSWRGAPDRNHEGGGREPMQRDEDRDGWLDHWRGPS